MVRGGSLTTVLKTQTGKYRNGSIRGSRGGMQGKIAKGTWESLDEHKDFFV